MLLGIMYHSLEHLSDHYVMVKAGNQCRVDCTSMLYIYIRSVSAPSTAAGGHKDVTPQCCSCRSSSYPFDKHSDMAVRFDDWGPSQTSYSYHIQSIHVKGV